MIEYEEDYIIPLLFRSKGSVAFRALIFAVPATLLSVVFLYMEEYQPGMQEDLGIPDLSGSQLWNAVTGVLLILLSFRTKTAFSRFWEGTGLLHQMRGEWFDTVSNCVTFSISAKRTKCEEVTKFRHTLVRLMSLCHGSALEEIAQNSLVCDVIDMWGLDMASLRHLDDCHNVHKFNKVEVMLHLVQSLITKAHDEGVLKIAPPILSRVYQTISRGFVNLLNAKKITDTKFPFPYAQIIAGLLFLNTILTPMMISQSIRSKVLAAIFTFIPIFGMYSVNFIACELENPFGLDDNDLPLGHFQEEMNGCLLMLLHPNTDMIACSSSRCIWDFHDLMKAMGEPEETRQRLSDFDTPMSEDDFQGSIDSLKIGSVASSQEPPPVVPATSNPAPPPVSDPPPLPPNLASAPSSTIAEPEVPKPLLLPSLSEEFRDTPAEPLEIEEPLLPPPLSPKAIRQLKEEEAARLEELQREVEQRINEFFLALQRWTLMMESQVKQIREMLEILRLLSTAVGSYKSEGWESAMHPI